MQFWRRWVEWQSPPVALSSRHDLWYEWQYYLFQGLFGQKPFSICHFFCERAYFNNIVNTSLWWLPLNEWYALMTRRKERQIHDCRSEDHIFAGPNILLRKPVWSGASPARWLLCSSFLWNSHGVPFMWESFQWGWLNFFSFSEAVKSHICSQ